MSQNRFMINDNAATKQPDTGLGYSFETTYTDDSGRVQTGSSHITPLFTVESYSYSATDLTLTEMSYILKQVAKGKKFKAHYLSPYEGKWMDGYFYVGKGSLKIGNWKEDEERYESLSFNMQGMEPL